jgi:26S proteasome regulatory subunit N12
MTDVQTLHRTLLQSCKNNDWNTAAKAIPPLKIALMERNALVPSDSVNPALLFAARDILEMAAITSIHKDDSEGFTRYYDQLQPFYLNRTLATKQSVMRTRVSGLYLLLLLSKNDIAGFHTTLEHLADVLGRETLEKDPNLKYPMELEQWLMEGAYNRVWNAANGDKVPSADYLVYTKVGFTMF